MALDRKAVRLLYRSELKQFLRDRRTLFLAILLPVLVMPLFLFASHATEKRREKQLEAATYSYAISGGAAARARRLIELGQQGRAADGDGSSNGAALSHVKEIPLPDPVTALAEGRIQVYLETLSAAEAEKAKPPRTERPKTEPAVPRATAARRAANAVESTAAVVPVFRVHSRSSDDMSSRGARMIQDLLSAGRTRLQEQMLAQHGFPVKPSDVAPVAMVDVAEPGRAAGARFGRFLMLMVVFLVLTGGSVVAIDSVAGEKERGTLETLLTTAAGRNEIFAAKQLLVLTVGLAIALLQVFNMLAYAHFGLVPLPEGVAAGLTFGGVAALLLALLPVAGLLSASLVYLSTRAKSYKEAQVYFLPLMLIGGALAAAPLFPEIQLRSIMALVPVANAAIAAKGALGGEPDWLLMPVVLLVNLTALAGVLRLGSRTLGEERLFSSAGREQGLLLTPEDRFGRAVPLWFALTWVVMFVVASNVPALAGLRGQILFNVVLLFVGGSLLLTRRFRLKPRDVFSLRRPPWVAWLAVLTGAPAGLVTAIGLFKLASLLLPVPASWLNEMGRQMVPEELPFWQILLFIAVIPGIGEELAFRGPLLFGLSRRMKPLPLMLTVGAIFGLFHVSVFRLLPTAFLGVLLSAVVLLTGSIFPAMLWHGLNNALSVSLSEWGVNLADLDPWSYTAAALVLAASFYLLWRTRRLRGLSPDPGGT